MTLSTSLRVLLATAAVTALTLGASGAAQAQSNHVYWSVGMSAPGMQVGVANMPPVAMYPQVAYPPVYVAPRPVSYYAPAPVYYAPPVWRHHGHGRHVGYGYGHGRGHGHGHGHERHFGGGHGGHHR